MEIRIHDIGGYILRNYVLETPLGWIGIDSGYPGGFSRYRTHFEKLAPLREMKYVFLTHAHNDHAGFLAELLRESGARLVASEKSLPRLAAGRNILPEGTGFISRGARLFSSLTKSGAYPPLVPDGSALVLRDESDQPFLDLGLPIRVVHLPGHTVDSIGLFLEESRELLCGDAASNAFIAPARHAVLIENTAAFCCSWDDILSLNPARIYPAHGNPFGPEDLVRFRRYLDNSPLYPPKQL